MPHEFRLGDWLVQPHQNQIARGEDRVRLDPRVMQVLVCLAERAGEVVPQEQIIETVWAGVFVTDGALTNAIWELRKALGDDSAHSRFIQTVPKKGYRLVADVKTPHVRSRWARPWTLAGVAIILGLIGVALYFRPSARTSTPSRPARFALRLPEGQQLLQTQLPRFALSPDGSRIVYLAEQAGTRERLYLRALDEFEAVPLPGTEGALNPFFSPNGDWIGFHKSGKLWKLAVAGGDPLPIVDALEPFGATWGADDTIVFQQSRLSGLYRVRSSGGTPEVVVPTNHSSEMVLYPQFLPGGHQVLFTSLDSDNTTHIEVLSLDTAERHRLIEGRFASYASTGHLVYALKDADTLWAVPFDRKRLEIRGAPVPILANVAPAFASAQFAFSVNGTLVYLPRRDEGEEQRSLVLVDRQGNEKLLTGDLRHYADPRFSPEGRRIAFASERDIWTLDVESGRANRLTFKKEFRLPVWSPDGETILFRSVYAPEGLFVIAADGTGREERVTSAPAPDELLPRSWSSGGEVIFEWDTPETQKVYALSLQDRREPRSLEISGFSPSLSPDGRWLAYVWGSPREVYVQPFPEGDGKWQVSLGGGSNPVWSPDGREIFYQAVPELVRFMAVSIEPEGVFSSGPPSVMFEYADLEPSGFVGFPNYDVSPDGKTFVIVKRPPPVTEFKVVLNWFEELQARVPTR